MLSVIFVDVTLVTVAAPDERVTVFVPLGSKPAPLMVRVVAVARIWDVLAVTAGSTVATCTGAPLLRVSVVTIAVIGPAFGIAVSNTVSDVAVALVTVPAAPDDRITLLRDAMGSKPAPVMTRVPALAASGAVLAVTPGTTIATCAGEPLLLPSVVPVAVSGPITGGLVSVIVNEFAVAADTKPVPDERITLLLKATGSKPAPVMVKLWLVAAIDVVFELTTGPATTVATVTAVLVTPCVVTVAVNGPVGSGVTEASDTVRD